MTEITFLVIGMAIGFLIKFKAASRLLKKATATLDKTEKLLATLPAESIAKTLLTSEEFILIYKQKGEWHFSAICKPSDVKAYCPLIYRYFKSTDSAVDEVNGILSTKN